MPHINLQRLQNEIQFFAQLCGPDSVYFSDDGSQLFFPRFRLPDGRFNFSHTPIVVVVPDGYGHGVALRDVFVDARLRTRSGRSPSHLFGGGFMAYVLAGGRDGASLARATHYPGAVPELAYLCIHPSQDVSVWEYMQQVFTYLSDPVG